MITNQLGPSLILLNFLFFGKIPKNFFFLGQFPKNRNYSFDFTHYSSQPTNPIDLVDILPFPVLYWKTQHTAIIFNLTVNPNPK